jgi:alpha-ketoglutarate-dependent taurine dioxygenase
LLANEIVEIQLDPKWVEDLPVLRDVLQDHFGIPAHGSRLAPSEQPDTLRAELLSHSRYLTDVVNTLRNTITGRVSALIVPRMHLDRLDVEDRGVMLYAMTVGMGYPTGTDPRQHQVVWPVTARATSGDYFATYSELDSEAKYHTDAQYYPDPERYFLLYVVRAARCGGGESRLRANNHLIEFLNQTPDGRRAIRVLQALKVPFRIPSVYTNSGKAEEKKYTFAPIFGENNTLRWREDTVEKGLAELPEYDHPDLRDALKMLKLALASAPHEVRITLGDDSLVLVDNHRAVHARTAFTDHSRHLLRIRFHDTQHVR